MKLRRQGQQRPCPRDASGSPQRERGSGVSTRHDASAAKTLLTGSCVHGSGSRRAWLTPLVSKCSHLSPSVASNKRIRMSSAIPARQLIQATLPFVATGNKGTGSS